MPGVSYAMDARCCESIGDGFYPSEMSARASTECEWGDNDFYASEMWPDTDDEADYPSVFYPSESYPFSDPDEDLFVDDTPHYSNLYSSPAPRNTAAATMPVLLGRTSNAHGIKPASIWAPAAEISRPQASVAPIWTPPRDSRTIGVLASPQVAPAVYPRQPVSALASNGRIGLALDSCIFSSGHSKDDDGGSCEVAGKDEWFPHSGINHPPLASTHDCEGIPPGASKPTVQHPKHSNGNRPAKEVQGTCIPVGTDKGSNSAVQEYTTVMVRNLPKEVDRQTCLDELCRTGFSGMYDFFYMPVSFATGLNQGFAFINFKSALTVGSFTKAWSRTQHFNMGSGVLSLKVSPAKVQGLEANITKWSSPRLRRIRNPNYLPFVDRTSSVSKQLHGENMSAASTHSQTPAPAPEAQSQLAATKPPLAHTAQGRALNGSSSKPFPAGRVMPSLQQHS